MVDEPSKLLPLEINCHYYLIYFFQPQLLFFSRAFDGITVVSGGVSGRRLGPVFVCWPLRAERKQQGT